MKCVICTVLSQLPSFLLERFPQILDTFQQKPEPVGARLGQAVAVGAQVVPRVEAVEGNHEIRVVLSPVQHLEAQSGAGCRGESLPILPNIRLVPTEPPAVPTWLSWARRSQRSRQMAVPDIVPRRGLCHLARPGSVSPLPGPSSPHPAPPGRSRPAPGSRVRPQRIPRDGQVPSRIPGGQRGRNEVPSLGLESP